MAFLSKLYKRMRKRKGKIVSFYEFDTRSGSMTSPICDDIDNDGSIETICATTSGEILVFDEKLLLKWHFKIKEKLENIEEMFLDQETSNSINHEPLVYDINGDGKKEIIFGTEYGKLYVLSSDGKLLWDFTAKSAIRGGINTFKVMNDDNIGLIFGSSDKNIYIMSTKGKLLRKIFLKAEIESTPIVINNRIYVGCNDGELKVFNLKGDHLFNFKTKSKIITRPVLVKLNEKQTALLIGSTDNNLYCISLEGELIWKFETKGAIYTRPLLFDINEDGLGEIIFGSADGTVYVLSLDGNQIWKYETDFWIISAPVAMDIDKDGTTEVVIGSYDNKVYVLTGKGIYVIDYIPGISGIIGQNGSYSDIPVNNPGEIMGDKLWEYKTGGLVVGCAPMKDKLIVQTKEGRILWLKHEH